MSSELKKVVQTNKTANTTLNELNVQFGAIKAKSNEVRKQQLRIENENLRQQIELAKQQLIDLETRNGKKQIPVPRQSATKPSVQVNNVQAQASPKPTANAENQAAKPSKDKKPKTEKNPWKKPEAGEKASAAEEVIDISRLDLRIGKIVEVQKHPDADALYLEKIDVGEDKPRTVISGLVKHVPIEEMQNRLLVVFCNLKPAKMRGILSEGMVLCASTPEKVELINVPLNSVPGDPVYTEGYARNPDAQLNPKKKIWETIAPDLKTNDDLLVCYKGAPLYVPEKGQLKAPTLKGVNVK
ncbi:aminoacyl tRNA synthase complex-interacting multifunctional protein 1-like [Sitodiplosis mosellana]|uniref:aminoacyl tRNA synthase complex-interacting multifunctional protein 1-like n=1 Tax=Sitodiplosis mosellana TaxID=263140 RepID=UPI002444D522|nr:aminoacyl tRNA synthase complex-interacting multifunctional protein 1-like [Sitodiplosis mosellana]